MNSRFTGNLIANNPQNPNAMTKSNLFLLACFILIGSNSCKKEDGTPSLSGEWHGSINRINQLYANGPVYESNQETVLIFREDASGRYYNPDHTSGALSSMDREFTYLYDPDEQLLTINIAPLTIDTVTLSGQTKAFNVTRFSSNQLEADFKQILLDPINLEPSGKWEEYWAFSR